MGKCQKKVNVMACTVNVIENLCAKLSIYLQSLPDTEQIFSCKIMKENVEIKDKINCWFSSSTFAPCLNKTGFIFTNYRSCVGN